LLRPWIPDFVVKASRVAADPQNAPATLASLIEAPALRLTYVICHLDVARPCRWLLQREMNERQLLR
jgi:hypothetical protein